VSALYCTVFWYCAHADLKTLDSLTAQHALGGPAEWVPSIVLNYISGLTQNSEKKLC